MVLYLQGDRDLGAPDVRSRRTGWTGQVLEVVVADVADLEHAVAIVELTVAWPAVVDRDELQLTLVVPEDEGPELVVETTRRLQEDEVRFRRIALRPAGGASALEDQERPPAAA